MIEVSGERSSTMPHIIQFFGLKEQFQTDSMKAFKGHQNTLSYLDVSQFIIKEASPLLKPLSPQHHPHLQFHRIETTPEIQPIDHDVTQFMLTPMNKLLKLEDMTDFMEDFSLESLQHSSTQNKRTGLKKREKRKDQRSGFISQLFLIQCDLEKIVEDDGQLSSSSEDLQEDSELSESQNQLLSHPYEDYKTTNSIWTNKLKSQDTTIRDPQEQKHTNIDLSVVDYSQNIERFARNPKSQIIKGIKQIENQSFASQAQKIAYLKKYLEQYILEFETFCYEQSWKELNGDFKSIIKFIIMGIEQLFAKKFGPISFEQRRVKLLKYLQKKKRRIWRKKVSYDCRKKVADGRLRIKGKFVTREQACEQLGLESLDNYSAEQIKQMLQRRIDNSLQSILY